MAIIENQILHNGYAYKVLIDAINIRESNDPRSTILGSFSYGNFYFEYTEVKQSTASSKDYFVKIAPGQGYTVGWVACSSVGELYIEYTKSQNSNCSEPYYTTEYSGKAKANYYWPDDGLSSYKQQYSALREVPNFYLLSSPGQHKVIQNSTNIVLLIDYNNGSPNKEQIGQAWKEISYNFSGWDQSNVAPPSLIAGVSEYLAGALVSSFDDLNFYADYVEDSTEDKYANNTLSLSNPTKSQESIIYNIQYEVNGGTLPNLSETVSSTISYTFNGWSGTEGVIIEGNFCEFTQNGVLTANYASKKESAITTLPLPLKTGYKFLGWGISPTQINDLIPPNTQIEVSSDIIYYAIWSEDGNIRIYINDSDKYKMAITYIYDGNDWKKALPYIHDGIEWKMIAG